MQQARAFCSGLSFAAVSFAIVALACSSTDDPDPNGGTGGASQGGSGTGGVAATGGVAEGGASGSGGSVNPPSGGASGSAGTGGQPASGGTTGGGGAGGTQTTGGGGSPNGGTAGAGAGGMQTGGGGAAGAAGMPATGGAPQEGGAGGGDSGAAGASGAPTGGAGGGSKSEGCGKPPPKSDRYSIDVDGTMREYILDVPNDYDPNRPYRLVFGWHPLGGSAQQVASGGYYGLKNQAAGAAIFVAAEGLPFQANNLGWANTNGRDLAFLEAMLDRFRSELCIDEERIFSTGFSFGGMMSFAVGCATNTVMRAIAPMAGNIEVSGCQNGEKPVAVMGFHGTEDMVVAIDGGRAGRDKFIQRNGCTQQTMPVTPSWCDGINNQPCSCVSYQGCMDGYPVIWCEFNAGHTPAPNSGATIWKFFEQF